MVWTRFKSYNLMYYETKDDFIKTKVNGTFYWLNKSQIANFGYTNLTERKHLALRALYSLQPTLIQTFSVFL